MSNLSVKWHCHEKGTSGGIPILFLHGFMAGGYVWLPTMEKISHIANCLAPDLPGHGRTIADLDKLDFDSLADALVQLTKEKFGCPAVLVGYSLGGRMALHIALKYPKQFTALVLESATAGIESEGERKERLAQDGKLAEALRQEGMKKFLQEWYRQPLFASLKPEMVEKIISKKTANDPNLLAEVVVRLSPGRQQPLWSDLPKWQKPSLLIAGELDQKYCGAAARMSTLLQHSWLSIIPGAGHIVHLENNADFTDTLKNFLTKAILPLR